MSRSPWLQKLLQNLQTADRMLALAWFHAFRLMRTFWQNHGRPGFRSLSAMAVKTFAGLRRAVLDCGRTLSLVYQRCVTLLRIYWPPCRQRLVLYARLARLDRPIGALLLLWPTLWALWIAAAGVPALHLLFVFVAGVFLTRSAGCVVNDYADRDFDPHVRRTRERPLATHQVSRREALLLALALVLMAFVLVLTTDPLTVKLSFIAIPLAVIYPFMKRYTYIPQLFLGLAFSWGIPMAFSAVSGHVPTLAWLVFIANILWVMVYDTLYAMVDREDDIRVGVKSTAILFGDMDRFFVGVFQVMTLTVLVIIGIQIGLDMYYYVFLFIAAVLMAYHQYLIRDRRPEMCFRAFLHNNWVGMAIFGGLWANYL